MKPVPRAGYRFGTGLREIVCQSRGFRTLEEALLRVQEQRQAGYARPERNVIFRRQPVRLSAGCFRTRPRMPPHRLLDPEQTIAVQHLVIALFIRVSEPSEQLLPSP